MCEITSVSIKPTKTQTNSTFSLCRFTTHIYDCHTVFLSIDTAHRPLVLLRAPGWPRQGPRDWCHTWSPGGALPWEGEGWRAAPFLQLRQVPGALVQEVEFRPLVADCDKCKQTELARGSSLLWGRRNKSRDQPAKVNKAFSPFWTHRSPIYSP